MDYNSNNNDLNPSLFPSASTRPGLRSQTSVSDSDSSPQKTSAPVKTPEALQQIFNTSLVRTQPKLSGEDISRELLKAVATPAFRAILASVQRLAQDEGLDEKIAAEQIIATFRNLDRLWAEYLCREGMEAVLRPKS